ncbi:MAG: hypothetical protein J6V25_00080 [Oscillospiraceae bacterium]|nr:hypothetical protein [Oscillospiraceae bacterium]
MENVNMNEKANISDELLEDISGGGLDALKTSRCSVCGNLTPNYNLVDHYYEKVCKSCMEKINNK